MDKIKGLASGFFHTWECGGSAHRLKVFKQSYKSFVDKGMFIRDVQNAPRDARYKIDHYYKEDTTEAYSLEYPYLGFHVEVLKLLNIDESFFWKKEIVDNCSEYSHGDFAIGFKQYKYKELYPDAAESILDNPIPNFYFKYKGEVNTLMFSYAPKLVDYSDKFWAKYKDKIVTYNTIGDLLHNMRYFMQYKNIL